MSAVSSTIKQKMQVAHSLRRYTVKTVLKTEGQKYKNTINIFENGQLYRGADKSLARPTSGCILFDGENISFDASLVIFINSTNIPPIVIINRVYENQNLLSL